MAKHLCPKCSQEVGRRAKRCSCGAEFQKPNRVSNREAKRPGSAKPRGS